MKRKIKTFIFVHDQQIILDFIEIKKFNQLKDVTFVFVGKRDSSKVKKLNNVIVCNDLPCNIEQYPNLTSFTGWYAIWKNNLYLDCDYLNLFEYDINIVKDFEKVQSDYLDTGILGYIPLSVHDPRYVKIEKFSKEIIESIKKNYGKDIINLINSKSSDSICSVTSNHTFSKKIFEDYMEWVNPLVEDIKNLEMSGHQIERSISFFYLVKNLKFKVLPGILEHFRLDSHKTQSINKDKFKNLYSGLLSLYNRLLR